MADNTVNPELSYEKATMLELMESISLRDSMIKLCQEKISELTKERDWEHKRWQEVANELAAKRAQLQAIKALESQFLLLTEQEQGFTEIVTLVIKELDRAEDKHVWPLEMPVIYQAAIIGEEAGEVIKAANDFHHVDTYKSSAEEALACKADLKMEIIQTAAMCFRMLQHLDLQEKTKAEETAMVRARQAENGGNLCCAN